MKKKILGGIAALAIAVVVAFNISLNTKVEDKYSTLTKVNLEAFAQIIKNENTPLPTKYIIFSGKCYNKYGIEYGTFVSCVQNGYSDCTSKSCS